MYTAKHAMHYKHNVPDGQAYVFCMDIRAGGKGYEEFVQRAIEEDGVLYLRGQVSRAFEEDGKVIVWGVDTVSGKKIEIAADLVVLAPAMVPSQGAADLARKLRIATDEYGFYSEAHPKLRPVESLTAGVYLAGAGQAPKDIPEAVAQASAAGSKVVGLFSAEQLLQEPLTATINEELCCGCRVCLSVCPYQALELEAEGERVTVTEALCQGCGACIVSCGSGALQQRNFTDEQMVAMVRAGLGAEGPKA